MSISRNNSTATNSATAFEEFMKKHRKNKDETHISPTNTRIGNTELNIYGGSYVIPLDELPLFHKLYHETIFTKKKKEYL